MAYEDEDREFATVYRAGEKQLDSLESEMEAERSETKELLARAEQLMEERGISLNESELPDEHESEAPSLSLVPNQGWDELVKQSEEALASSSDSNRGVSTVDLLPRDQLDELYRALDRPRYKRLKWDRWDYLVSFGIGGLGALLNAFVGTPGQGLQRMMADKDHWLGSFMERVHSIHKPGAPVDYQGYKFGGGYHRGRTMGHDLMRFVEGILQFRDGQFRGWYFQDGVKIPVVSDLNQYGTPYGKLSLGQAVLQYAIHMFCDFFSSTSLPLPGTSYLFESPKRELRVLSQDLYKNGVHTRLMAFQTLPIALVHLGGRIYNWLRTRGLDVPDEAKRQKAAEIVAVGLSFCAGLNIGKVALTKNPFALNVPVLLATAQKLAHLTILEASRNSDLGKGRRNIEGFRLEYARLEKAVDDAVDTPLVLE